MNLILALSYIKRKSKKLVVIFVDSEKLTTLLEVLKEFGLDNKTRAIIQQYLSNTISKVKFMGEISDAFDGTVIDELAIFFDLLDTAAEQINELKTQTAKAGFHISLEKTEFITNIKSE